MSFYVRHPVLLLVIFVGLASCVHGPTPISRSLPERGPADVGLGGAEGASPLPPSRVAFDWPVDAARLTRGYLPHKKRPHLGIDLAAPKGTPILASRAGMVIYRGRDFRGYGRMVLVESGDGWATLYAHLDKYYVEEGQQVTMGEPIGSMGRTGRATGVHLHFEIRRNRVPLDPMPLLPAGTDLTRKIAVKPGAEY